MEAAGGCPFGSQKTMSDFYVNHPSGESSKAEIVRIIDQVNEILKFQKCALNYHSLLINFPRESNRTVLHLDEDES